MFSDNVGIDVFPRPEKWEVFDSLSDSAINDERILESEFEKGDKKRRIREYPSFRPKYCRWTRTPHWRFYRRYQMSEHKYFIPSWLYRMGGLCVSNEVDP